MDCVASYTRTLVGGHVANLVATMTGADPSTIEVDVKAHAGIDTTKLGLAAAAAVAIAVIWRALRNLTPVR